MLYQIYQNYADGLAPLQSMAASFGDMFGRPWFGLPQTQMQRSLMAACQIFAEGRLQHHRPEFGIDSVKIGNGTVPVTEEKIRVTPFSTLLHFAKETPQPAAASQGSSQPSSDINALIAEAGKDFADYQRLTAQGRLGEAGQKLDALKGVLDKLNAHKK